MSKVYFLINSLEVVEITDDNSSMLVDFYYILLLFCILPLTDKIVSKSSRICYARRVLLHTFLYSR